MDLPFQSVGSAACWGAGGTLARFVGLGVLFALKEGIASLIRRITQRGQDSLGI